MYQINFKIKFSEMYEVEKQITTLYLMVSSQGDPKKAMDTLEKSYTQYNDYFKEFVDEKEIREKTKIARRKLYDTIGVLLNGNSRVNSQ